jgi:ATP-dependent Lhr-like helicase
VAAATSLAATVRGRRISRLTIETVGGHPVGSSPFGEALIEAGFERTIKGVRLDA